MRNDLVYSKQHWLAANIWHLISILEFEKAKNLKESIVEGLPFLALLMKRLMVAINKLPHSVQIVIAPIAEQAQAKTVEFFCVLVYWKLCYNLYKQKLNSSSIL